MSDAPTTPDAATTDTQVIQDAADTLEAKLNPEPTPDEPQTPADGDETPAPDDETPDDPEGTEKGKTSREAAKYRKQAREAQAERDTAKEHIGELQAAYVELMLSGTLKHPEDFGRYVPFENLLAEDGKLDRAKITAEVEGLLANRPELGTARRTSGRPSMPKGNPAAPSGRPTSPPRQRRATDQFDSPTATFSDLLGRNSVEGDGARAGTRESRVNLSISES